MSATQVDCGGSSTEDAPLLRVATGSCADAICPTIEGRSARALVLALACTILRNSGSENTERFAVSRSSSSRSLVCETRSITPMLVIACDSQEADRVVDSRPSKLFLGPDQVILAAPLVDLSDRTSPAFARPQAKPSCSRLGNSGSGVANAELPETPSGARAALRIGAQIPSREHRRQTADTGCAQVAKPSPPIPPVSMGSPAQPVQGRARRRGASSWVMNPRHQQA